MIADPALAAIRADLEARLAARKSPFHLVDAAAATAAIARLERLDPEHWAATWVDAARPFEDRAAAAEAAGDAAAATAAHLGAYALLHVARFPSPTHPAKLAAYRRSVEHYRAAGSGFDPPLEVVTVPFHGRADEGSALRFYVRRPARALAARPVVVRWGGVDTWKEERREYDETLLAAGFATVAVDMPGVGESPVLGSLDAERQFVPLFDWLATQPDLDARRIAVVGMSYGGYWATKVAHLYADRVAAAVNWGGGVHRFFSREWCLRSASARSYLMDITLARARTVGATSYDAYIERVAGFSLVDQGILDRPHAPMLLLNGRDDEQIPSDDLLVLTEHGAPKHVRFFPGGHMGYGPDTFPTVVRWLQMMAGAGEHG